MTSIRQRLQQDLTSGNKPLLQKVLQDKALTPAEYQQLKTHYAGQNSQKKAEFDAAFKDFSQVNFGLSKSTPFGKHTCVFPDLPRAVHRRPPERPPIQTHQAPPQVIIPKEAKQNLAQNYLKERKFWDFIKLANSVNPQEKAQFMQSLVTAARQMQVGTQRDYGFAKQLMQNAKSLIPAGTLKQLAQKVQAYERFTGQVPGIRTVLDANQTPKYLDVLKQSVRGPQTNILSAARKWPHDFKDLVDRSIEPDISGNGTPLENLVGSPRSGGKPSCIDALRDKITDYKGRNLDPATVMKLALEVTGGDLPLANLTLHNLFKYIAYTGRPTGSDPDKVPSNIEREGYLNIVDKLGSLRPTNSQSTDKMGPWYHFFGIQMVTTAYNNPETAKNLVQLEQLSREGFIRAGLQTLNFFTHHIGVEISGSPVDTEKAHVNQVSVDIARRFFQNSPLFEKPIQVPTAW